MEQMSHGKVGLRVHLNSLGELLFSSHLVSQSVRRLWVHLNSLGEPVLEEELL